MAIYFVRSLDGRYLQAQMSGGSWKFWLEASKAFTAVHETVASAEQYRAVAAPIVGELVIVAEAK